MGPLERGQHLSAFTTAIKERPLSVASLYFYKEAERLTFDF